MITDAEFATEVHRRYTEHRANVGAPTMQIIYYPDGPTIFYVGKPPPKPSDTTYGCVLYEIAPRYPRRGP